MQIRKARTTDVPSMVEMIANDPLGSKRENLTIPLKKDYYDAFERIDADQNQELMVVENETGQVIAVFQMTFIPYLTYQGGIRVQIEGVRVHSDHRGKGLGKSIFKWAIQRAKVREAHLLQLTTDKKRPEAIEFYKGLGFEATHEGMKLHLK